MWRKQIFAKSSMALQHMKNAIINYKNAWRISFLFGGLALAMDMIAGEVRPWMIVLIGVLILISVISRVVYSRRPNSIRSLLLFMDTTFISMISLLVLMIFNALRPKSTYLILLDYYYIAILVVIGSLCYGVYFGLRYWPRNIEKALNLVQNSEIKLSDLYDSFFDLPGFKAWSEGKYRKYFASLGVVGVAMAGIYGGHQYVYLIVFIVFMGIFPANITSILVRRIYYWRYFGRHNVQILDM